MISVIVPAYNAENYIERCLDSILCQTYGIFEVILINDGSTDRTGVICDEYAQRFPQIRVIHQKNAGEAAARNHGLKLAGGDYVIFVDADDYVDSCLFQTIIGNMKEPLDLLLLGYTSEDGKSVGKTISFRPLEFRVYSAKDSDLLIEQCFYGRSELKNVNLRSCWGKVFRSSFLRKNGIHFPEKVKIGEDMLFMLQVYSHMDKAKYCPEIVYHYFFHNPASVTNRYKPDLESAFRSYAEAIRPWLEEHPECRPVYAWYRLNDIILYMKFDFFHPRNKEKKEVLKGRMERILLKGDYIKFYDEAKKENILNKYSIAKRLTIWCAVKGHFGCMKEIYRLRYH